MIIPNIAIIVFAVASGLCAQSASSKTFFLAASELSAGGRSDSTRYRMLGSFAATAAAGRTASSTYVMQLGFSPTLTAQTKGKPILSAVTPGEGPLLGGSAMILHGTQLQLGLGASVRIGGQTATISRRAVDRIHVRLPRQLRPGTRSVRLTTSAGEAALPKGIDILPLIELAGARRDGEPFVLRYRAARGDAFVLVISARRFTSPILRLPPFHYGLALDPTSMLLFPALVVSKPTGVFDLNLPAVVLSNPLYAQALSISSHSGWRPGSFTNTIQF